MDYEETGQLARATLEEIASHTSHDDRLRALVRLLWHVDALAREEVREACDAASSTKVARLPGWTECVAVWQRPHASATGDAPTGTAVPSCAPPFQTPSHAEVQGIRRRAAWDVEQVIQQAPGPLTTYSRQLAAVAANAHLACQWGCFAAATPMLLWCATTVGAIRARQSPTDPPDYHPLDVVMALALVGSTATETPHPTLATALARRLAADFGAMARAAARLEGMPGADPRFDGPAHMRESIGGLDPDAATASVRVLAQALEQAARQYAASGKGGSPPGQEAQHQPHGRPAQTMTRRRSKSSRV